MYVAKERGPDKWATDERESLDTLVHMDATDRAVRLETIRLSLPLAPRYFPPKFWSVEGTVNVLVELPGDAAKASARSEPPPTVDVVVHVDRGASERTALLRMRASERTCVYDADPARWGRQRRVELTVARVVGVRADCRAIRTIAAGVGLVGLMILMVSLMYCVYDGFLGP